MEDLHLSSSSTKLSKFTILDLAKVISVHLLFQLPVSYLGIFPVFFITSLTDPNAQKISLELSAKQKETYRSLSPCFSSCETADFRSWLSLFGQLCATWTLFWLFLRFKLSLFYSIKIKIRHFNLGCPRGSYLFTAHPRMLSRTNCAIFSRIILFTMIETILFARSTKTFELP